MVTPVDIAGIGYFAPILAFLIVLTILFALLNKTKLLGESLFVQLVVSFVVATIFVSAAGVRDYVLVITPWFGALVVSLFFILFIIGFVGKPIEGLTKGVGIVFVVILALIFLVSAFIVFSELIGPYLPGSEGAGADPNLFKLTRDIYNTRVFGAMLLLVIGLIVSWVLVKGATGDNDKKK
ncbi:MAG: hypothetical protein Q7S27_04285 [Nanoarchaeota archaeon]|nr:hypothetical protein [Nanoarchaeota archaeon]